MVAIVLVALKSVWLDQRTTVSPVIFWILCFLLLSVNAAYFVARYLKKSGLLHGG